MMTNALDLGVGPIEPDSADLLEVERNRAMDETIRLWFILVALRYANNHLADVAHNNYMKANTHYLSLFNVAGQSTALADLKDAMQDRFHTDLAQEAFKL